MQDDFMGSKRKILTQLKTWLEQCPEDCPEVMRIVTDCMINFREAEEKRRNVQAMMSIDHLFGLLSTYGKTKKLNWRVFSSHDKAVNLIDAIVYRFPKGLSKYQGMSQIMQNMIIQFCIWYFDENDMYGSDWEKDIKGYHEYMTMLKTQYDDFKSLVEKGAVECSLLTNS